MKLGRSSSLWPAVLPRNKKIDNPPTPPLEKGGWGDLKLFPIKYFLEDKRVNYENVIREYLRSRGFRRPDDY